MQRRKKRREIGNEKIHVGKQIPHFKIFKNILKGCSFSNFSHFKCRKPHFKAMKILVQKETVKTKQKIEFDVEKDCGFIF